MKLAFFTVWGLVDLLGPCILVGLAGRVGLGRPVNHIGGAGLGSLNGRAGLGDLDRLIGVGALVLAGLDRPRRL